MNTLFNHRSASLALLGAMAVAVTGMLLATAPAFAADDETGTIQSVSETQVVVRDGTERVAFKVNDKTEVTLNGKAAKIEDLKAGDSATVAYSKSDEGEKTATKIEAKRAAPAPEA